MYEQTVMYNVVTFIFLQVQIYMGRGIRYLVSDNFSDGVRGEKWTWFLSYPHPPLPPPPHFHGLTWQPNLCFYITQWSLPKTPKLLSSFKLWIQLSRVLVKLMKKVKTPATVYSENFMTNENRNIVFPPSPPPPCTVLSWYIFNLRAHLASLCS